MGALTSVVLTDRAATPVNHTFTPRGHEDKDGGRFVKAGASPIGDYILTVVPTTSSAGRKKVNYKLSIPVLQQQTVNGITSYVVVRTARANVSFDFAADSTSQERKDLCGMISSGLASTQTFLMGTVVDGEAIW